MTETINEQLKKLISKLNSIQGSLLSMGKRLTALEEKKPESDFQIPDVAAFTYMIHYMFGEGKPWLLEEIVEDEKTEEVLEPKDSILGRALPKEEVIDEEVLEQLDEIIESD